MKLTILGAGESGIGSAYLAKKLNYNIFVSDKGNISLKNQKELNALGVDWEQEQHSEDRVLASDLIVKSPGIPEHVPLIQKIRAAGIEIISEIEFAFRHCNSKIIAITGSNGKTTTTSLIFEILKNAGFNVGLAGNIGFSFAKQVAEKNYDFYVIEVSSFQLDDIKNFKPDISILTNITPDHLDRYQNSFELYAESKLKITQNQKVSDHFIYYFEDEGSQMQIEKTKIEAIKYAFSLEPHQDKNLSAKKINDALYIKHQTRQLTLDTKTLSLKGPHNHLNMMAAGIVALILDVPDNIIQNTFQSFANIEHRMEKVEVINGIEFVNDSKATNVVSVKYALDTIDQPIVWIVGGKDKGNDYSALFDLVRAKVKCIVALGKDNEKILTCFKDFGLPIADFQDTQKAVDWAFKHSDSGDCVLLSPACASFDLFNNYEDRGRKFKKAVASISDRLKS